MNDARNKALREAKKDNSSRTYPIKHEVRELRKNRGDAHSENKLFSYRKMREFSKASGTWGIKNNK